MLPHDLILQEVKQVLDLCDTSSTNKFMDVIRSSRQVISYGAGRVGFSMRGFSKRLSHLGFNSYFLEDTAVPSTRKGDLLILASGSGETASVRAIAEIAVRNELIIVLVTARQESSIASLSNLKFVIPAPNKTDHGSVVSSQPMTSLFEQALMIFFDAMVLKMMSVYGIDEEFMKQRHNVLE